MGGYVGVLVLLGGSFVIQFFGDIDRSSQYVKIYRIEGAALSKQVFNGGSLDLTVFSRKAFADGGWNSFAEESFCRRKAFADGGSLDLTAGWINFVKGKAFIVVRSSDLNRDLQLDKMNVLTVCTTGLYMDPARPDRREQVCLTSMCLKALQSLSLVLFLLCRSAHITLTAKPLRNPFYQSTAMPRREKFPAPRASQLLHAGLSQGGNCLPQAPSASQSLRVVSSQERPSYKTVLLSSPSLDQGHCLPQAPRASQSLCAWSSQQGNCLLQAPSASQSLRVGSSPKRPSYKTVLLSSPSLDQGPRASQPLCAGSSQEGNCLPQAPSAFQSLRAGSSQERPSYLTVLCSSPSLDQGNCLLQPPSVSQSLHVGSSLEKRTDRSILYSPSLDQKPHVLDQPLVKTVGQECFRRRAPSTPQSVHVGSSQEKRTCRLLSLPGSDQEMHVLDSGIQYVVEGIWKKFWFGWISSETSLSNERKFLVSIYPFGSRDEANAYRLAQYECETGHTVKFYFLDGVNIVIERVQADVHSWIDNKYEYWSKNGKRKPRWWDHIRDEFIQIFRNVMVCLRHIYSKRIYSGKLIDGISVINNRETKLIWFVKAATVEEFNNGSRRDIIDLRQLMVEAVLKPYMVCNAWDRTKEQAAIYFVKQGLPNDLRDFIERLYDENFVPMNLDWLLDDPVFWSPDLKLRFFRDLHEIVRDLKLLDTVYASIFLSAKLGELNIANWECLIPQEGRERQVLNKMRHDQKYHNNRGIGGSQRSKFMGKGKEKVKEKNQEMGCGESQLSKIKGKEKEKSSGSGGNKFIEGDIFSEILQFCRNLIEHYDEKLPCHERKPKEEISLIADKIFHGACSMLRNSILEAWMAQPSSLKTERPEYMNRLMTDLVINRRQV